MTVPVAKTPALVSVVIPTRNRPELLFRAVTSALNQTYTSIEVVVVIDGPDQNTVTAMEAINDQRVSTIALPASVGGSDARNAGVKAARGAWVAFLDDDDEWLPEKIARQLDAARASRAQFPFVSCRLIAKTPRAAYIWPRRLRRHEEHISDYLFARGSFFRGEGSVQTSTLLAPREFFVRHGFRSGLMKHQDTELVLRAGSLACAEIIQIDEPLAIHHIEEDSSSVSNKARWEYSLQWALSSRNLFTRTAYAAFLLNTVGAEASNERAWNAVRRIVTEAARNGAPRLIDYCVFSAFWILPQKERRQIRDVLLWATRQK